MRFLSLFFFLCLFLVSGCTEHNPSNQPKAYYDVLGFVQQQITALSSQKPLVKKSVAINETHTQEQTQNINWKRELDLFTQTDINKPALQSSYQISHPDSLTYRYTLKNPDELVVVRSLTVQLDATSHQPRLIEALLQTSNPLYTSERHLWLESGPTSHHGWQLKHYKLVGFQKLPFFQKNEFIIDGIVQ